MLQITTQSKELWDEKNECFVYLKPYTLQLEHSLVSISKWETKWHKAFLGKQKKTDEETLDYIRCMTINQNVPPEAYLGLSQKNIEEILSYINDPMTSVKFPEVPNEGKPKSRDVVTSEVIYNWMIVLNIPIEFQKWHLNRLFALIRVYEMKNAPKKKRNRADILRRNAEINEQRLREWNTKG